MLSRHVWLSINGKYCDILSSKPALPANLAQSSTKHMPTIYILHFLLYNVESYFNKYYFNLSSKGIVSHNKKIYYSFQE